MRRASALLGALVTLAVLTPASAAACGLALLLAIDVSSSVDAREYRLQTEGHAAALRDPQVVDAILSVGGVKIALMHWSGNVHQTTRTEWTALTTPAEIEAYAALLARIRRRYDTLGTALAPALRAMRTAWSPWTDACRRRVVDVSGDGVANAGGPVDGDRAALLAMGVTINALVIRDLAAVQRGDPDPAAFYANRVIGGPGAFMTVTAGFENYADAFRRKLLREIGPPPLAGLAPGR